jgi:hypothetical protein
VGERKEVILKHTLTEKGKKQEMILWYQFRGALNSGM